MNKNINKENTKKAYVFGSIGLGCIIIGAIAAILGVVAIVLESMALAMIGILALVFLMGMLAGIAFMASANVELEIDDE